MGLQDTAVAQARILTVPNALSLLRLLGVPLFLWLVLGPSRRLGAWSCSWSAGSPTGWTASSPAAGARCRRLGQLLDPAADRLYILADPDRPDRPRHRPAVARPAPRRPRRRARVLPAGPAAPRLRSAARALPGQGRDVQPAVRASRCCSSATATSPVADVVVRVRLGVRDLGHGAVLVGRVALPRAGPSAGRAAAPSETARWRRRREGRRDGRRRRHPAAPDDGKHAQAAAPDRQQADHGARAAAARTARLHRDRRHRAVPRHASSATTSATARTSAWTCTTPPRRRRSAPRAASRTPRTCCATSTFLVISGDALTDFDLTDLVKFHHDKRARWSRSASPGSPTRSSSASPSSTTTAGCSASSRSPPGARCSPTPSTPASTSWSRRSSTTSPRASPSTGPPTSSPRCSQRGQADLRLRRRGLLGGRRHARVLHAGAGRRA